MTASLSLGLVVILLITVMFVMPSYADHSFKGKFVGLSDNLVLGDVELVGLEAACVHTFNHRTRVCTSEEIIKAPPLREMIVDVW